MTKNNRLLRFANALAFVATVAVNILANTLPLGGMNTGQISAMYPTLLTPPGLTFSIWGVIYTLLGIFILMQLFIKSMNEISEIGIYFILSCFFNIAWILSWHSQLIGLATLSIIVLLGTLVKIYISTRNTSIIPKVAFSIYYAWITIATMISIFIFVKTLTGNAPVTPIQARGGLNVPGNYTNIELVAGNPEIVSYVSVFEYIMAIIAIAVTAGITIWHILKYRDYYYVGTVLWALGGIIYKQIIAPVQPTVMLIIAIISIAIILYTIAKHEMNLRKYRFHPKSERRTL